MCDLKFFLKTENYLYLTILKMKANALARDLKKQDTPRRILRMKWTIKKSEQSNCRDPVVILEPQVIIFPTDSDNRKLVSLNK